MEVARNDSHRRHDSSSSCGIILSSDDIQIGESFVNDGDDQQQELRVSEITPGRHTNMRQRLGAEMAIIASSSPEIKSLKLNLPPVVVLQTQNMEKDCHSQLSNNDTCLSCSSPVVSSPRASPQKSNGLSALIASMDDVSSPLKLNQHTQMPRSMFADQTDELVQVLRASSLNADHANNRNVVDDSNKHVWWDEENINPSNLFRGANTGISNTHHYYRPPALDFLVGGPQYRKQGGGFATKVVNKKTPRHSNRSLGLHRRGSVDSLPSPAEIGLTTAPVLGVQRAASVPSIPSSPLDMDPPSTYQQQQQFSFLPRHQKRPTMASTTNNMPVY